MSVNGLIGYILQKVAEDYIQYLIDKGQIKVVDPKQGDEWTEFLKQYKGLLQ